MARSALGLLSYFSVFLMPKPPDIFYKFKHNSPLNSDSNAKYQNVPLSASSCCTTASLSVWSVSRHTIVWLSCGRTLRLNTSHPTSGRRPLGGQSPPLPIDPFTKGGRIPCRPASAEHRRIKRCRRQNETVLTDRPTIQRCYLHLLMLCAVADRQSHYVMN